MSCGQNPSGIFIAPGSQKWYWYEFTDENLGASEIVSYLWDIPIGFASVADLQDDNAIGILLSATGADGDSGELGLAVTTDADEILQHTETATITTGAQ